MKCGRLLPLLLSLLLSVSLLAPAALARETEFFPDFPEPVPASAQDWSPADPSSFDAARQALLTAVRGEDASERSVLSLLSRMTDRFNELLTEYYFCSLDYMRSPASCTQEYVRYSSVCGQAESDYLSAVQEVLNSALVMASTAFGSCPKAMPPSFTLGHEMLISSISTGSSPSRSTTST